VSPLVALYKRIFILLTGSTASQATAIGASSAARRTFGVSSDADLGISEENRETCEASLCLNIVL
jgi:hypothetical protein